MSQAIPAGAESVPIAVFGIEVAAGAELDVAGREY
jgi:hypothetical protein